MARRLPRAKAIGGAPAAKASRSRSVMDRTKIRSSRPLSIRQPRPRQSISADASTPQLSQRATAPTAHCKRLTRPLKARSWLLLAPLIVFVVGGCTDLFGNRAPKESCPRISILSDAAQATVFRDGAGRDLRDVRFQARFGKIAANCDIEEGRVDMRASIKLVAARGPASTESVGQFTFFVALTDPSDEIIAKKVFESPLEFQAKQQRSGVIEQIEQVFVLKPGERAVQYSVLVGFQLTRDQLEYNRRNRGR